MTTHEVVSQKEWLDARKRLWAKEKELTHLRDRLSAERRALPWQRIDKEYTFDGPNGRETLVQLFGDESQLVVYHFMFAPEWDVATAYNYLDLVPKGRDEDALPFKMQWVKLRDLYDK